MTEDNFPYRGLSEDFKSWYFNGTEKYQYDLNEFSAEQIDKLFLDKVNEYEEYAKQTISGKVTEAQRIRAQNELAKYIFKTAFKNFTDKDWEKLCKDPKIGRGAIIQSMRELFSFLAEVTNPTEAQHLRMRLNMMR
jgi:hypothetical protein